MLLFTFVKIVNATITIMDKTEMNLNFFESPEKKRMNKLITNKVFIKFDLFLYFLPDK